jgi:hypothetical protein
MSLRDFLFLLIVSSAQAATLQTLDVGSGLDRQTVVISTTGVTVNGTVYDVSWRIATPEDVFGDFPINRETSLDLITVLNNLFNDNDPAVTRVRGFDNSGGVIDSTEYRVGFGSEAPGGIQLLDYNTGEYDPLGLFPTWDAGPDREVGWTTLENIPLTVVTPIPLPASALLLGPALLGLGFVARRRRTAREA